jgi:hypothetical protein
MPVARFAWNPQLVDVRREACPRARWNSQTRAWTMTAAEVEAFVAAGHVRLEYCRMGGEIIVDGDKWLVGFLQGAPRKAAQSG